MKGALPMGYTREDIIRIVREEEIEFIRMQFVDIFGQLKNVAITAVFGLVMGTVTASGIPEAIIAAVLVTVIGKALLRLTERMKKR